MKRNGRAWLVSAILTGVLLARLLYHAGAACLRREAARLLAADLENLEPVETLGRILSEERLQEEWIAALQHGLSGVKA